MFGYMSNLNSGNHCWNITLDCLDNKKEEIKTTIQRNLAKNIIVFTLTNEGVINVLRPVHCDKLMINFN